jgi:pimeloyl-ACP methyl ester carboxylesterase
MTTKIFAIHGAFSTPRIFSYLKLSFPEYEWKFLDYRTQVSDIKSIINDGLNMNSDDDSYHVIGHSMGGLIALSFEEMSWAKSIATISTPLGGLDINLMQTYLSRSQFLSEIASSGKFISSLQAKEIIKPTLHIVSTNGFNPYVYEKNDGVVTVRSQKLSPRGSIKEVEANHSEVMMHEDTITILKDWWYQ